jgi:hypothetical protein
MKILIDSSKLLAQHLIEDTHYFFVAFHNRMPFCHDFSWSCASFKNLTTRPTDSDCHSGSVVVAADHNDDGSVIFGVGQHSPFGYDTGVGLPTS